MRSVCVGAVCVVPLVQGDVSVKKVAEWTVNEVATVHIADNLPGLGKSVVGTTFGPFGKDNVYALGPLSAGSDAQYTVLSDGFKWPNEAKEVPEDVKVKAGLEGNFVQVADGFLFPGKSTGGIHLVKLGDGLSVEITKVTEDKSSWFYHHSDWADMDMDGILDLVAARATSPFVFGSPDSELVWVKNNGDGTFGSTQVITKGPGVAFRMIDIDGNGSLEVVATEFFKNQQLAIYTCPEASWADCATKQNTVEVVISSGEGPFFDLDWVDLNGDGKKDILCTAQQYTEGQGWFNFNKATIPGRALAFEQPADWTAGSSAAWTRHVLSDGYLPQPKQPQGSGAPGAPSSFIMDTAVGGKPHIVLSSDDGGSVDILEPATQSPEDWTYNRHTIYTSQAQTSQGVSTIGTVIAADVDGDGRAEILVPSYAENKLILFTFDPESSLVV